MTYKKKLIITYSMELIISVAALLISKSFCFFFGILIIFTPLTFYFIVKMLREQVKTE